MTRSEPEPPDAPPPGGGTAGELSAAVLRVSATLDLDAVLREVVESARALTDARLGVIAVVDQPGARGRYHFSGFEHDEEQRLAAWPDSSRLFEHLRGLPAPLRSTDLEDQVRGLDLEPPVALGRTFLGMPMRHGGVDAGIFFLAEKEDGRDFDDADEAVLSVLAAQAAAAVANARAHRAERRARADLEALVETSPVGVVRFDAATGALLSLNREARRMVDSLRTPGHPAEQLLQVVTCRRADGSEWSLAATPLAEQFASSPEAVRAEEVVLSVPDGRSVRALVNVTPVPAGDDGGAGSVVATLQDLAPLDEIDRMRSDFLALVGHELRQPLVAIKGSATTLFETEDGLDPVEAREFHRIIVEQADHMRGLVADLLDAGRIDAGTLSVAPEPADVATLIERTRTAFLRGGTGHDVVVDLPADLPPAMADPRRFGQVLANLLANAARHAPPSTPIRVAAARQGAHVAVSVADQGSGIAPDRLPHLFRRQSGDAGTAGHGLGLAVSKGLVEAHGGRIQAESDGLGRGTVITFTLPAAGGPAESRAGQDHAAAPPAEPARVLVVDDDPGTLRFVRGALAAAGFAPVVASGEGDLGRIVRREKPRLVLLDLMLPGADGIELMRTLPELADVPVIFISGYGRDETIARALAAGAADYLVKPFSPTELAARVGAALRRTEDPDTFRHGDLLIDYGRRRASVAGRELDLTATEFDLLRILSLNVGRVVAGSVLLRRIWPARKREGTNVVRTFVASLRHKLGDDAASPVWVVNERGVGYRMPRPEED